jgi:hypothetical protein
MKRLITITLMACTGLLASACGPTGSGTLGPAPTGAPRTGTPTPTGQATGVASASPSTPIEPSATITIETWFTRDQKIFLTHRTRPATVATSRLALTELIAGPSGLESAAGVGNAIPLDTTFTVTVSGGVATVSLPGWFYDASRARARLRQAQVVYTLTQFPTVSRVGFQKDGQATAAPVGRADYADLLPPIIITKPAIGQRLTSPITVTGIAATYESSVYLRLLDAAGKEIATTYTTSHCLPRCPFEFSTRHGNFSATVAYRLTSEQPATLQVSGDSADGSSDGPRANVPVVLAASAS